MQQLKKQILSADLKIQGQQEELTTVEEKLKMQAQRAEAAEFECAAHVQTIRELNSEVGHLETLTLFISPGRIVRNNSAEPYYCCRRERLLIDFDRR
jgi:hypothetical protein